MRRRPHRPSQRAFGPRRDRADFDNRGHRRRPRKTAWEDNEEPPCPPPPPEPDLTDAAVIYPEEAPDRIPRRQLRWRMATPWS